MENKDLHIEIELRFKEALEARFNLDKFDESGINKTPCPLCDYYEDCEGCPFGKFTISLCGCEEWMELVHDGILSIIDLGKNTIRLNMDEKENFAVFVKKAQKLITFVPDSIMRTKVNK